MLIFLSVIIEILLCYIFKEQIVSNDATIEVVQIFLISINTIIASINIIITKKINKKYKVILIVALIIRTIMVFIDQYVVPLPNSGKGKDTESYHAVAIEISQNINDIFSENVYGGIYTKILGMIYYLMGPMRLFAQSLNCFIGLGCVILISKILEECKYIECKKRILCISSFFLQGIIFSSILLRETIIAFLVTLSIFYCMKYIHRKSRKYKIITYLYIIMASAFHTGVAFIAIGYLLIMTLYDKKENRIIKSTGRIIGLAIAGTILIAIYINFSGVLGNKINNVNVDKITNMMETTRGESAYLTKMKINSIKDIILFSIPKAIYFILSPMPWDARNIIDIITFLADSIIYGYMLFKIAVTLKKMNSNTKNLLKYLFLGLIICIFIFGIGTYTAGAASRHRHKLFYYICILYILTINEKYKLKIEGERNENNILSRKHD